jgi:DNA polymerase I-like protein with 3'-5' exonuclease and polymerase domains
MARYDAGRYARESVEGDVHSIAKNAVQFNSRDNTKTAEYAYLYGAGDFKLGTITYDDFTDEQKATFGKVTQTKIRKLGKITRARLIRGLNGMEPLLEACHKAAGKKRMRALDGRNIHVPSKHSSLNTLLQHLGGLLSKVWMVLVHNRMEEEGLLETNSWLALPTDKVCQILFVHDELQFDCDPEVTDQVATLTCEEATKAGEQLHLRVQVDAEAKIGDNWKECH